MNVRWSPEQKRFDAKVRPAINFLRENAELWAKQARDDGELRGQLQAAMRALNLELRELARAHNALAADIESKFLEFGDAINDINIIGPSLDLGRLLHIAYYRGGTTPRDIVVDDLDYFAAHGWNGVRAWATWWWNGGSTEEQSPILRDGSINTEYMDNLVALVGECESRGMSVDISISGGRLNGMGAHAVAIRNVISALNGLDNWFFDIANEHASGDERFRTPEQMAQLADVARNESESVILTGSIADLGHLIVSRYVDELNAGAQYSLLTPHFFRGTNWHTELEARCRGVRDQVAEAGYSLPVHPHEEIFRNWNDPANNGFDGLDEFLTAIRGARRGGAAGFTFNDLAGLDGPTGSYESMIDPVSRSIIEQGVAAWNGASEGATFIGAALGVLAKVSEVPEVGVILSPFFLQEGGDANLIVRTDKIGDESVVHVPASPKDGYTVRIKRRGPHPVRIVVAGGGLMDGEEEYVLSIDSAAVTLVWSAAEGQYGAW